MQRHADHRRALPAADHLFACHNHAQLAAAPAHRTPRSACCLRNAPGSLLALGLGFQGTGLPLFGGTLFFVPDVPGQADGLGTFTTPVGIPGPENLLGISL